VTHTAPNKVGLELVAELLLAELFDRAAQGVAGVVDHDVQPSEVVVGAAHGLEHGLPVGHIQTERQQRVAMGGGQVCQGVGVAGSRSDLITTRERRLDEVTAEAAGRAGHEPGLAHGEELPGRSDQEEGGRAGRAGDCSLRRDRG
jgi:hypothetical protein